MWRSRPAAGAGLEEAPAGSYSDDSRMFSLRRNRLGDSLPVLIGQGYILFRIFFKHG